MRTCFFVFGGGGETESSSTWSLFPLRASGTLLSVLTKDGGGTGEGPARVYSCDARNGFPDDMLKIKSNASYVDAGIACKKR